MREERPTARAILTRGTEATRGGVAAVLPPGPTPLPASRALYTSLWRVALRAVSPEFPVHGRRSLGRRSSPGRSQRGPGGDGASAVHGGAALQASRTVPGGDAASPEACGANDSVPDAKGPGSPGATLQGAASTEGGDTDGAGWHGLSASERLPRAPSTLHPPADSAPCSHTHLTPHVTHQAHHATSHAAPSRRPRDTLPRARHAHPPRPTWPGGRRSAAVAEAGGLGRMSHRPEVPSTLQLLEGVEVSLLLSLKFFNFLLLYPESQVSPFPGRAPWPRVWARPSVLHGTHRPLRAPPVEVPTSPRRHGCRNRSHRGQGLAGGHTTLTGAEQHPNRVTGSSLAPGHSGCPERPSPPDRAPGRPRARRGPTPHLPAIELVIPVVEHGGAAGHDAVPNGILTDGRHLSVPRQN